MAVPLVKRVSGRRRRGLRIPLGVDASGRGALVADRAQDEKIIKLALSGNDNNNAFQLDPGLGDEMVFDPSDAMVRGRILLKLRQGFAEFERQHRFKLLENTIKWSDGQPGELVLDFQYHNLETDDILDYSHSFTEGS